MRSSGPYCFFYQQTLINNTFTAAVINQSEELGGPRDSLSPLKTALAQFIFDLKVKSSLWYPSSPSRCCHHFSILESILRS
jgi:hypothetical protein